MKKTSYILLLLSILLLVLSTCRKKPELKVYELTLTEESVTVTQYSATITANYSYPGDIPQIKVFVSNNNDMSNSIEYNAELDENTLRATINNLSSDTKYYYRFRYSNGISLVETEIKDFTTEHAIVVPTLTTTPPSSITYNSAITGGNISDDGGSDIVARGVCWSTEQNPTIEGQHTENGTGVGAYTSSITNLEANTLYYVKAYATNGEGTGYGNEIMFVTSATLATVSTKPVTDVTESTAQCGGSITDSGGVEITSRGVCWSTGHNPTISDLYTTDGTGTGEFISEITGLNANLTYYVRAYATSEFGTAYGEEREFQTIVGLPVVTTISVTDITASSAISGGNVISDGGNNVIARGVCWATTQNPTTNNSHTSDGTGTGAYTSSITGLTDNVTYYVRAYATNNEGTSYGEQKTFTTEHAVILPTVTTLDASSITQTSAILGGQIISEGYGTINNRGVCWSTSQNPTINGQHVTNGPGGIGSFTNHITGLNANTTYYVRAYATNEAGTAYGEQKTFTTSASISLPTVTTNNITDITTTTATGGGNVTSAGGGTVSARGICWSTSQNPTISHSYTTNGTGTGSFTSSITGLSANTTYYVRAYATNEAGTAYGAQRSFTTLSGGGTVPTGAIDGLFSISATQQVYFSKGNLQYQASSDIWRFAENQWDYIGDNNSNISPTYTGWIDLFGWGTGNNPTNSGSGGYDSFSDWGNNTISNGGNTAYIWRTLTKNEWVYVFDTRSTTSGIRYAKAKVNGYNGVILLPDDWSNSYYSLNNANTGGASYSSNIISAAQWTSLEQHGAVFLPAAGSRAGTSVLYAGSYAYYWSSTYMGSDSAYRVFFNDVGFTPLQYYIRGYGCSVRLICD